MPGTPSGANIDVDETSRGHTAHCHNIALITLFSCGPLAALQHRWHRWHRGGRPPQPQSQCSKSQKATSRRPTSTRRPQPQSFKPQHPDSHANPAVHGFGNHGVLGSLHASGVDFIWPKDDEAAFASQWLHRALRRTGTTTTTTGVVELALDLGTGTGRFARSLVEHGTARQVVAPSGRGPTHAAASDDDQSFASHRLPVRERAD